MAKEVRAAQKSAGREADVRVLQFDLSALSSVEDFVQQVHDLKLPLHILVNNGGIYDLGGTPSRLDFSPGSLLKVLWSSIGPVKGERLAPIS